ncbi:unnamed protein product [Ambrosiozyma monospora]|uniref:Unnamed protein product n=1 Tax=Ambrosiozyma monospora TaxID=43982 RepID=A0ACB5SUR3_AMBMO|nr:unnamed protein product [Ambrosiozyma monospora]
MYSALPTSRQSSLAVNASEFYDIYTSLDKDASSWESPRLTPVSSSTWITNIPYVTTTGVFSDVYVYAQCDALYWDIFDYASIYNDFFSTYTNTEELSSFREQMTEYLQPNGTSQYDDACTSMASFISKLPWKGRVEADAKEWYKLYTTKYLSVKTISNPKYHTTTFTDTSVDITNAYQYLLYQQARYYAVLLDYQNNVDQYTSLMTSYLFYENHTSEVQDFTGDLVMMNKTTSLNMDAYSGVYSNISKVYSLLTWSDRLAYVAKQVYESYNNKYLASDSLRTVTATGASTTANTVTSIIPSAMPVLTSNVVTATATAAINATNVFPVIVLANATETTKGQTQATIGQTTVTLVETVNPSSTYTNGTHATVSVSYDLISVMYHGADALMMDFQVSSLAYSSYISNNINSAHVSNYISILNSCSTKNLLNPASSVLYTQVLAGLYGFIFKLPPQFRPKLYDILGYAYMNSITATTPMTLSNYQLGGGALFRSIFTFGGLDEYGQTVVLTTINITDSDGLVYSLESTITEVAGDSDVVGQHPLIFPTSLSVYLTATSTQEPQYFYSYVTVGRTVSQALSTD